MTLSITKITRCQRTRTKRHGLTHLTTLVVVLLVVALAAARLTGCAADGSNAETPLATRYRVERYFDGYRCRLPLAAMPSLGGGGGGSAPSLDTCRFGGFFRVQSAWLNVSCGLSEEDPTTGEKRQLGGANGTEGLQALDVDCRLTTHVQLATLPTAAAAALRASAGDASEYFGTMAAAVVAAAGSGGNETHAEGAAAQPVEVRPAKSVSADGTLRDDDDPWRFDLRVSRRERRDGTDAQVHYKGYDGNGFSVCCDLLAAGNETECQWIARPKTEDAAATPSDSVHNGTETEAAAAETVDMTGGTRVVRRCALPLPGRAETPVEATTSGEGDDTMTIVVANGSFSKPLPHLVGGRWEMVLEFWRRRQSYVPVDADDAAATELAASAAADRDVLGRVLIPFRLDDTAILEKLRSAAATLRAATDATAAPVSTADEKEKAVSVVSREDGADL